MGTSANNGPEAPRGARIVFGIFMVLFYIAIGLLFIFDIFSIDNTAISCSVGGILIAYGIWRGIRMYLGRN